MTDRPAWVQALLCRDLTPTEYRVWSYLSWRQGGNGHAWPSQATIAGDLGLTVQGIRNITRRLAARGWLRLCTADTSGRGHTLRYEINTPAEMVNDGLPFAEPEKVNSGLPFTHERVNGHSEKGSTAVDPNTIQGTLSQKRPSVLPRRITFDRQTGTFIGIDDDRLKDFYLMFPDVAIETEILKAAAWAAANPGKSKKNWDRFVFNWFSRADRNIANRVINNAAKRQREQRPSFAGQVSTVGEVVDV